MENLAVALTRYRLGNHYRTYPQTVEAEVKTTLASPSDFSRGPVIPSYATRENETAGFVGSHANYLSARWPGDAWTLAAALINRLRSLEASR
jgi:protease I